MLPVVRHRNAWRLQKMKDKGNYGITDGKADGKEGFGFSKEALCQISRQSIPG